MNIPFLQKDLRSELDIRLGKVREAMEKDGLEALLIAQTTNIYYLTGCVFRGYVYVRRDREPLFFFIRPSEAPDSELAVQIRKPEAIVDELTRNGYGLPKSLGLEFDGMFYSDVERLKSIFPEARFGNASDVMRKARIVKTEREIAKMKEDGLHQVRVYSQIEHCYKEDMTDLEFQIEIERLLRREGCLGYLRVAGNRMELNMGSVLSGDNADVPSPYDFSMGGQGVDPSLPVGANGTTMMPGTTVMVDVNGGFNGYQTDMTRVWYIGEVEALAVKAHQCSIRILRELEEIGCPGTPASELYNRAIEMARAEGLSEYFMGHRSKAKFIGHGVGIELNEAPVVMERNHQPLEENMVIALEPKFVIPHVGAVGVENTYRVTPSGLENLTVYREDLQEL